MDKDKELKIYKNAILRFGVRNRLNMCMEECAELIAALEDKRLGNENNVEEEIVDVRITLEQLKIIFGSKKIEEYRKDLKQTNPTKCLAELIQAINKYFRYNIEPLKEMVRVEKSLEVLIKDCDKAEIEKMKKYKLNRLVQKVEMRKGFYCSRRWIKTRLGWCINEENNK